ncbi:HIT zinc finger protein [Rutstroemia sp. NJR-2017a WRK4]|nr:HIT zinc finger protein [Rutstroemia sp. NJR-2017a WRK4]
MNFGVVELATSRNTLAPGWAYVPDVGTNIPSSAIQPSARRAARASQKTFANHLSDYEALAALPSSSSSQPAPAAQPAAPTTVSTPTAPAPNLAHPNKRSHKRKEIAAPAAPPEKRSHKKKDPTAPASSTPLRQAAAPLPPPITLPVVALSQGSAPLPKAHPGDSDPLLVSRVPTMPTQEELERLLAQPPLSYNEARGGWTPEDRRKPMRVFCEVCGYWGKIRCTRCSGRVCALDCLNTHKEECFTRYGA